MFWFTKPSSGSHIQCLAKNYVYGANVRVNINVVSVMAAYYAAITLTILILTCTLAPDM